MNLVLQEIDDRKAFLDRMTQLGQGKKYASQIRGEIADVSYIVFAYTGY